MRCSHPEIVEGPRTRELTGLHRIREPGFYFTFRIEAECRERVGGVMVETPGVKKAVNLAALAEIEFDLAIRKGYATSVPVFPVARAQSP